MSDEQKKIILLDESTKKGFELRINLALEKGFIPKWETFRYTQGKETESYNIILVKSAGNKFDMNKINEMLWGKR